MSSLCLQLPSGQKIPQIAYGLFLVPAAEAEHAVLEAIKAGYRHFDGAYAYRNEEQVGSGFAAAFEQGLVKREDLFVTSKLWVDHHRPDRVKVCLQKSLAALKLSYLDLYLVHAPCAIKENTVASDKVFDDVDYVDTWLAMEELHREGLVRAIGVSNHNIAQMKRIMEKATHKPDVIQVESHPMLSNEELFSFCRSQGIVTEAYSPFASPGRSSATPDDPHPLEDPIILEIATAHKKTSAQVLLRWHIQRGNVVLVKSLNPVRMRENFEIADFELSVAEMARIAQLDSGRRVIWFKDMKDHPYYPI